MPAQICVDKPGWPLIIEETAGMVLAHWALPDGEKLGLGVLSVERYRDPEQRRAWLIFMRQQAGRMLAPDEEEAQEPNAWDAAGDAARRGKRRF